MKQYPNVRRWYETIAARPAVQKGYKVPEGHGADPDADLRLERFQIAVRQMVADSKRQ